MVITLRMQRAVDQQVRVVRLQSLLVGLGLVRHHRRAQHQIGGHEGRLCVVKRQHIGGVVFLPVVAVQRLAFLGIDDAHRDFRVALQCMANPSGHAVARQRGAVQGGVFDIAELERQLQRVKSHFGF